jgi:hypothetical protein
MPKQHRKARSSAEPLLKKYGPSGLSGFIKHMKGIECDLGNMLMLEPHQWLDYACVGVAEDYGMGASSVYRCVYDLNLLEHAYALMYAYEEFGYTSIDKLVINATPEQFDMAQEWVSYNTLRATPHMGQSAPLFIRSHDPKDWQTSDKWAQGW